MQGSSLFCSYLIKFHHQIKQFYINIVIQKIRKSKESCKVNIISVLKNLYIGNEWAFVGLEE